MGDVSLVGAFLAGLISFLSPCVLPLGPGFGRRERNRRPRDFYSAGLAIPFLLTALGIRQFLGFYKSFRTQLHRVELASGGLLVLIGARVFLNRLTWLSGKLTFLNRFSL